MSALADFQALAADIAVSALYEPSPIKRRRATARDVDRRRAELLVIAEEVKPATVRQIFYQATVRGIVEKTEAGYNIVQCELVWLRMRGVMPWDWIADHTRWMRKPSTWRDPAHALEVTATLYRKALWTDADAQVEIWLEKDALSGVNRSVRDTLLSGGDARKGPSGSAWRMMR